MIPTQPVRARLDARGEQVVEVVVDHGYQPQSIVASAGVPLRLVFHRRDDDACTDRIVFSSPRLQRRLSRGSATTIVLPAQPPGEIRFTCGMGRYHGQIELRSEAESPIEGVRARARGALLRSWRGVQAGHQANHHGDRAMTHETEPSRADRRATAIAARRTDRRRTRSVAHQQEEQRSARIRTAAFGVIAIAVLGVGAYLAVGDLLGQRGAATATDAIPVRLSMAGFTPAEIHVRAGQTVALELWTTDAAPHLQGGVHTMISDQLGIYEELAAAGPTGESRRLVALQMPAIPGSYDIYCDTCCGGKESPSMHGKLIVEA